jgi:hypothetical protein
MLRTLTPAFQVRLLQGLFKPTILNTLLNKAFDFLLIKIIKRACLRSSVVERLLCKQRVGGSNPSAGSILNWLISQDKVDSNIPM